MLEAQKPRFRVKRRGTKMIKKPTIQQQKTRSVKAGVVDLLNPQGNTSVVVSDQLPHGCRC